MLTVNSTGTIITTLVVSCVSPYANSTSTIHWKYTMYYSEDSTTVCTILGW